MQFLVRPPRTAALRPFVESLWSFEADLPHQRERVLPDGRMQLLINLHEDELRSYHGPGLAAPSRFGGAVLCGPFDEHFAIDTAEQKRIMGVSFTPGGAFPFFRPPCDAARAQHVELVDLWGRDARSLRERLCEAATPAARLQCLEQLLLERVCRSLEPDGAIGFAVAQLTRDVPVTAVGERIGLSARSFIRRFSERVGLTPKRFARIQRFQRVLAALERGEAVAWAQVAADCGYFDQAHLIHDFRAFSGLRPSEYHARAQGGRNHVVLT
jgi:AraC-like DNA-binding protein